MSNEIQKPSEQPAGNNEEFPLGMFPSPVVDEFFDPYENPQDRADYVRLGGSQAAILRYATLRKLRQMQGEPGSYPDTQEMIEEVLQSEEREAANRRIKEYFRRREP